MCRPCRAKAEAAGPTSEQLRGYQQRVADAAKQGGNIIFVAPTGSGKTAVAVAHSVHVLQQEPAARIVFLAPTVPLAQQQTGGWVDGWVGGRVGAPVMLFSLWLVRLACPPSWLGPHPSY